MKKVKFFALMFLAGATLFTSCKKDETLPAATISVSNNTTTYTLKFVTVTDTSVLFNVTVTAEAEIESYSMKKTIGSTEVSYPATGDKGIAATGYTGLTSYTYHFDENFLKTETFPQTFKFSVTDKDGNTANVTVTINYTPVTANTPFATEVTSGTFYHIAGLLHGAYNLDGDATVGSSGTASTKSMVNTDAAGATFTGSWVSDDANATQYVKTTTAYADIYQENATTLYAAGTANANVTGPAANDVYIGKKGTTYYVISILTIEPTYSDNTGNNHGRITFKYKK